MLEIHKFVNVPAFLGRRFGEDLEVSFWKGLVKIKVLKH
jgi:hypothetical protein